jgi:hypothetical protein
MASLAPYNITLGGTDYPAKYAGLLAYIEPFLTNLEMFSFSGGNVGLGVTPSAWLGAGYIDFPGNGFVGNASSFSANTNNVGLNAYYGSAAWRYKASGLAAQRFGLESGVFAWYTAPSGTAGNAISFTQAMTLDASGNLGIGTSSPTQKLDVRGAENGVHARFGSISNRGLEISTQIVSGTTDGGSVLNARGAAAGTLIFQTDSTERARITSGGDLLVGTTTVSGAGGMTYLNQGSTGFADINNNNAGATGYVFSSFRRSSVEIGSVTQNGTTAVLYNTTSDRRLKDNIVPAPSASDVIDAIQIVSHGWKSAPDEQVKYGVIAQDLHAVAPQAVLQGDDGEEIEKTWGVDYSKLVPMLIKEVQQLRARVAALEQA